MGNRKLIAMLFTFALSFSLAFAEEESEQLSLKDALEIAYKNNVRMAETRKEIKAARARLIQAKAYPNPEIEVETYDFIGNFEGNQGETEIGLSQEIEIMGKRKARKDIAQDEIKIINEKLNLVWTEVALEVKGKYNELLLEEKKKELAIENLNLVRKFLDNVQMKYKSGRTLINEVIRVRIELFQAENELLMVEKEISLDKDKLNLLLNMNFNHKFMATDNLIYFRKKLDLDNLTGKALTQNPELKIKILLSGLKEKSLKLSKSESIPNPIIGILGKQEGKEKTLGVSLSLSLPLWYRNQGEIAEIKVELKKIEEQIVYLKKEVRVLIRKAFVETELAEKQVVLLKKAIRESNELLRVVSLQYKEGQTDFLTYLENLMTVRNTRVNYYEAVFNYNQKIALIEKIINRELK